MHQFVIQTTKNTEPSPIQLSPTQEYPKIIEATFGLTIKQKIQQPAQAISNQYKQMISQKRTVAIQTTQYQQNNNQLAQNKCANCRKWQKWALKQQQMLLQLQKQLIAKEQKLQQVMQSYRKEIKQRIQRTSDVQLALEQKTKELLEQTLIANNQKLQEKQIKQNIWQTPQKQNKNAIFTETGIHQNKIQTISLKDIHNTDKTHIPTKDSTLTTKAQGWQCPQTVKKKHIQRVLNFSENSQLQKYVFENQTLKDYNAVLLERLRASKYKCKGVIC